MPTLGREHWINPPTDFGWQDGVLTVSTGRETDFWNNTFYGFRHDNGHLLATAVGGDFTLTVAFSAPYATLYDQAGAMLRRRQQLAQMRCRICRRAPELFRGRDA